MPAGMVYLLSPCLKVTGWLQRSWEVVAWSSHSSMKDEETSNAASQSNSTLVSTVFLLPPVFMLFLCLHIRLHCVLVSRSLRFLKLSQFCNNLNSLQNSDSIRFRCSLFALCLFSVSGMLSCLFPPPLSLSKLYIFRNFYFSYSSVSHT